ncbi:MAG: terpene cyclase/mutase family protein [bacterium]|nr:terpene cyclase/mutase family protein [bacterium]
MNLRRLCWWGLCSGIIFVAAAGALGQDPTSLQKSFAGQDAGGIPVTLRIEGSTQTFFDGAVDVAPCTIIDTAGREHPLPAVAACALQQAAEERGFTTDFQDFGFGLFLKRIGDDDTPPDFSRSWNFWLGDDPSSVGLDSHRVTANDRILLAFAASPGVPLRVTAPEHAEIDTSVAIRTEKRVGEFDERFVWHGRWEPAAGATLTADEQTHPVPADGTVTLTFPKPGSVTLQATGTGLVRSARGILIVTDASPTPTPTPTATPPTPTPTPPATPSPTPPPAVSPEDRNERARAALQYLRNRQGDQGDIDGDIVTGWSAIAFGAHGERGEAIRRNRSLLDALADARLTSATDIERQILAVRAAGANPRAFADTDLIQMLKERVRNGQIGEEALLNDDIFGVLAFLAAGEPPTDPAVQSGVRTILQQQAGDGSVGGLDLTAAAIQALRAYAARGGSTDIGPVLDRARTYLRSRQDRFGGFGENSATTSWAIQAIIALGEDPASWRTPSGGTPWTALLRYQNVNGGFGWRTSDDVSAFMTAYAAPALLGVSWPVTLLSVEPVAAAPVASPTPTPKATPKPRVAGTAAGTASTAAPRTVPGASRTGSVSGTPSPTPSAEVPTSQTETIRPPPGFVPLAPVDRQFALTLFSTANIGIGVSVMRMVSKLRGGL